MDPPNLDLKKSTEEDTTVEEDVLEYHDYFDVNCRPVSTYPSDKLAQTPPRIYAKKTLNVVTDPKILYALKLMASRSVQRC